MLHNAPQISGKMRSPIICPNLSPPLMKFPWRPLFFTLSKNKTGFKFIETLNVFFVQALKHNDQNQMALITTMGFPHQVLARTKYPNDSFIAKTMARLMNSMQLDESRAFQKRLRKTASKKRTKHFLESD